MLIRGSLTASLLSLAIASPALAQDHAPDFARPGFYLGAFVGLQNAPDLGGEIDDELGPTLTSGNVSAGSSTKVDPSLGIGARAGYRLNPYLAGELRYQLESGFDTVAKVTLVQTDFDPNKPGVSRMKTVNENLGVDAWTLTADARAFLPLGRVHPFATVGVGLMSAEYDESTYAAFPTPIQFRTVITGNIGKDEVAFAARFGGGIELYLSEHVLVGIEASYVLPTGPLDFMKFISGDIGVQYRF